MDNVSKPSQLQAIERHQQELRACRRCPDMQGPPVTGTPVASRVLLVGQAPGEKEIQVHRPFAWTAGKTLFGWFSRIGMEEEAFRHRVYMAAMCRCFPGKQAKGGDRVPAPPELERCGDWLDRELRMLQPELIIPVGKLAIGRFIRFRLLKEVVGTRHTAYGHADVIPLPHPSGVSTWHRTDPGKQLLGQALELIREHPAWQRLKV